jgi:hypothetical protein
MLNELTISAGVVSNGTYHGGGACSTTNEEVQRNLPCPGRLFQQRNSVIAVFWRSLRKRRTGWTFTDNFQPSMLFCLTAYLVKPSLSLQIAFIHFVPRS